MRIQGLKVLPVISVRLYVQGKVHIHCHVSVCVCVCVCVCVWRSHCCSVVNPGEGGQKTYCDLSSCSGRGCVCVTCTIYQTVSSSASHRASGGLVHSHGSQLR